MKWETKLNKAIKKVGEDLLNMPQEEFERELEKHSDGDIAKIMNEIFSRNEEFEKSKE